MRKSQKIAKGLESEISNLNSQLVTLKRTLLKEKEEKMVMVKDCNEMKEELAQVRKEMQRRGEESGNGKQRNSQRSLEEM